MNKDISKDEHVPSQSTTVQSAHLALSGQTKGLKRLLPFLGPAFIASVAYIDPGNFATNIAAGSQYGYLLLWVILASNLMAVLIQTLSAKLGIATGRNLPEIARENFPKPVSIGLWIQGELVIMATDLAEFIVEFQRRGFRPLEAIITGMIFIVVIAFGVQVFYAKPELSPLLSGLFIPKFQGVDSILLAAGILGATVMPHAIYLHSALTQRRVVGTNDEQKKKIFRFEFIDIIIAMVIAGAINASMLIVAAALFFKNGLHVEDLDVAFNQFSNLVGPVSAALFGIGLLSAGLSSSSVGTMSGDIIMQGFIRMHIPLYLRRFITMIPPLVIIALGVNPTYALVMSQVVLSFGIAFALVPLIMFTSSKKIMGALVNHRITTFIAWIIAILVIILNIFLLYQTFVG